MVLLALFLRLYFPPKAIGVSGEIEELIPIRGCTVLNDFDFQQISKMGCNYVQVVVWPQVTKNGEVVEFYESLARPEDIIPVEELRRLSENTEEIIVNRIRKAHELGYKVYLVIYPERTGFHEAYGTGMKNPDKFLEEMKNLSLKWARIAEENDVEMFSPVNELFLWVGEKKANRWHEEMLPELKKVYNGYLAPRGLQFYYFDPFSERPFASKNTEFNFSGWDYITSDFYCIGIEKAPTEENILKCIIATINKSIEMREKYDAKGVFYGEMSHPAGTSSDVFDLFFRENYGKVDGWFLWSLNDYSNDCKEVAKDYFTRKHDISNTSLKDVEIFDPADIASRIPEAKELAFREDFEGGGFESKNGTRGYKFEVQGTNYTVKVKFRIIDGGALIFFERNSDMYEIQIIEASRIAIYKSGQEGHFIIAEPRREIRPNRSYLLEISRNGNDFAIYLDGELVHAFSDPNPPKGSFDLTSYYKEPVDNSYVIYEEVAVLK